MMTRSFLLFVATLSLIKFSTAQTIPCENGMAGEYPCTNVALVAHVNPQTLLSEYGGVWANDIWGWTDPLDGTEYVIIGLPNGTSFLDISDPENPVFLGFLASHNDLVSQWRDMKVYSNHVFIVSEAGGHGMQVFDLTKLRNVTNAPEMFQADAHYDGISNAHNIVINEATGYAYAVGARGGSFCNAGGLHMINIQDPLNPVYAGCFDDDFYTHDAQCVIYNGPDLDYVGKEICINSNEDAITIVDVTDKENPIQIASVGYSGTGYTHQGWLTEDHQYYLANDELDELYQGINTRTLIWDFSDLDNPWLIDSFYGETNAIDHNLYVHNGYVFESNYNNGLRILETSNIANGELTEIAYFDSHPVNDNAEFNGNWSNYPYFESGIIAISDINRGLFLLKPNLNFYVSKNIADMDLCENATMEVPIEVVGENETYQWQIKSEDSFENLEDDEVFSGTNTAQLSIDNITLDLDEKVVRCVVSSGTDVIYSNEAMLSVHPLPIAEATLKVDKLKVDVINSSFHAEEYSWDFGDGSAIVEQRAPSHTYSNYGEYVVTLTAMNGCGSDVLNLDVSLAITSSKAIDNDIRLYPVPASTQLNFKGSSELGLLQHVTIYDASGKLLRHHINKRDHSGDSSIDISSLQEGVYLLTLSFEHGKFKKKIMIQR